MKASELIQKLAALMAEYGDLPVHGNEWASDGHVEIRHVYPEEPQSYDSEPRFFKVS